MTRMPALKPREVIAILEKAGYYIDQLLEVITSCVTLSFLNTFLFPITLKTLKEAFYTR